MTLTLSETLPTLPEMPLTLLATSPTLRVTVSSAWSPCPRMGVANWTPHLYSCWSWFSPLDASVSAGWILRSSQRQSLALERVA